MSRAREASQILVNANGFCIDLLAAFQSDEELIAFYKNGLAHDAIRVMRRYGEWTSAIAECFQQVRSELTDENAHFEMVRWDLCEAKKKITELEGRLAESDGRLAQAAVALGFKN